MAEARNYHDHEAGSSLDDDIERWREESEVEICRSDGDPESDLHQRLAECKKNPGHVDFIPEPEFTIEHLPVEWRDPWVYKKIREISRCVVHLSVKYTSPQRPDGYFFSNERGQKSWRFGTGTACFPSDYRNKQPQQCPFKNCKVPQQHNVTPEFYVATASHVVFDSNEAEQTEIGFFFDCKNGTKGKAEITAQGLRVVHSSGMLGECCTFTCVSHNLNIRDLCRLDTEEGEVEPTPKAFDREEKKPEPQFSPTGTKEEISEQPSSSSYEEEKKPEQPLGPTHTGEKSPEPPLRDTNSKKRKPLVVIVSHPHGSRKHVSTGYWTGVKSMVSLVSKIFGNTPLRTWKELMGQAGWGEELIESMDITSDKTFRHFCQDSNVNFNDIFLNGPHDLALLVNCPFTVNEIAHKVLLAMWEKTTSKSTLSGQVSDEELTEINLSVVNDIISLKCSDLRGWICQMSLSLWKTLTSDSTFSRQLCREAFSEICKQVVNDRFGTTSITFRDIYERMCCTNIKLFFETILSNEGCRMEDEVDPFRNMTAGQVMETFVDDIRKDPGVVENPYDRMLYSAQTCPGSSGAPVLPFYDKDNGEVDFDFSLHFGVNKGNNMSSHGKGIWSLFEKLKPTDELKQEASQDDIKPTNELKQEASEDDIPLD